MIVLKPHFCDKNKNINEESYRDITLYIDTEEENYDGIFRYTLEIDNRYIHDGGYSFLKNNNVRNMIEKTIYHCEIESPIRLTSLNDILNFSNEILIKINTSYSVLSAIYLNYETGKEEFKIITKNRVKYHNAYNNYMGNLNDNVENSSFSYGIIFDDNFIQKDPDSLLTSIHPLFMSKELLDDGTIDINYCNDKRILESYIFNNVIEFKFSHLFEEKNFGKKTRLMIKDKEKQVSFKINNPNIKINDVLLFYEDPKNTLLSEWIPVIPKKPIYKIKERKIIDSMSSYYSLVDTLVKILYEDFIDLDMVAYFGFNLEKNEVMSYNKFNSIFHDLDNKECGRVAISNFIEKLISTITTSIINIHKGTKKILDLSKIKTIYFLIDKSKISITINDDDISLIYYIFNIDSLSYKISNISDNYGNF